MACGENELASNEAWHWLQKQQSLCSIGPITSHQQVIASYYHCILGKTSACIKDMTDYHRQPQSSRPILLHYFCGCIKYERIQQVSSLEWHIHTSTNVRLHMEEFSLAHYNWECKQEWLEISSVNGVDKLCGKRLPWKRDLPGSDVIINLQVSKGESRAYFVLFYHMLIKLWKVEHIVRMELRFEDVSTAYYYPDFTVNDEVCLHYISKTKLHYISLNVFHRTQGSVQVGVTCLDGPGSKSPTLDNKDVVESEKEAFFAASTYQMYCVFAKKHNYSDNYHIYSVVGLMYRFDDFFDSGDYTFDKYDQYESLPFIQISKDQADFSLQFDSSSQIENNLYTLDIGRDSLFKEHFYNSGGGNNVDLEIHSIFDLEITLKTFAGFLSDMVVERGHCIYGGLFVLSYRNYQHGYGGNLMSVRQVTEDELWHLCEPFKNTDMPIYLAGGITRLVVFAYKGYLEGKVNIQGTITIKESHRILNQNIPTSVIKYFKRGREMLTSLELTDEKNIHFVLQPLAHSLHVAFNFRYVFKRKGISEHTSETLLLTFEYYGSCTYCYVEYASDVSQFVHITEGRRILEPVSSSSVKYSGTIESSVKALIVNQSNCQTPQMWTLLFKYFTNYDISNAWNSNRNRTFPHTLLDYTEIIWSYSQYSPPFTFFLIALKRNPSYSTRSDIWKVKFDTMCLITGIFVEQVVNDTDGFVYTLYKWQNKSETLWLSGCDHCNVILISDPDTIPASCNKTIKYVDRTIIKRYYTIQENLVEENNGLGRRNFTSYGMRYDILLIS